MAREQRIAHQVVNRGAGRLCMAALLTELQGRFILSLNDVPEVRRLFAAFAMEAVPMRYTIGSKEGEWQETQELIITNVPGLADLAKGGAGTPLFGR